MRRYIIYLGILAALLSASAEAGMASFLQSYNISASVSSGFSYVNITYLNLHYSIVYRGSSPYLLVNTSSSAYSFVTNTSLIASIIRGTIINKSISAMNLASLKSSAEDYLASSSASLNDCATETGIDRSTCTLANYCNSCAEVPSCNKVLYYTGGPNDTFGKGIITFESQYSNLTNYTSALFTAINSLSSKNAAADAGTLARAFGKISNITQAIPDNPIFPPPSSADLTACQTLGTLTINSTTQGPWYCNAVGYCTSLAYNYTLLSTVSSLVNNIENIAPTNQSILSAASAISTAENIYAEPLLYSEKLKELGTALNTTLADYNNITNESAALLSHISNESLSDQLRIVESNYTYMLSNYLSINITAYAAHAAAGLSKLSSMYNATNATYSTLDYEAKENTALLLADQIGTLKGGSLEAAAYNESLLNAALGSSIGNISSLKANLDAVHVVALQASPSIGLLYVVRGIDGPFSMHMARLLSLSYASAVSAAPLFSALLSLIIGAVIMLFLFLLRHSLRKKGRLAVNKATARAWRILFVALTLIVVVYVLITYALASEANASARASALSSALRSSGSAAIIVNNTNNTGPVLLPCAEKIAGALHSIGKNVQLINATNGICSYNGTSMTIDACIGAYAEKGSPAVVISYSTTPLIHIYSMYGTRMDVNGDAAVMNACYASLLIR